MTSCMLFLWEKGFNGKICEISAECLDALAITAGSN